MPVFVPCLFARLSICLCRGASPVGLARRVLIPQNNSTTECYFCDPVILAGPPILSVTIDIPSKINRSQPTGNELQKVHLLDWGASGQVRGNRFHPGRLFTRKAALLNQRKFSCHRSSRHSAPDGATRSLIVVSSPQAPAGNKMSLRTNPGMESWPSVVLITNLKTDLQK